MSNLKLIQDFQLKEMKKFQGIYFNPGWVAANENESPPFGSFFSFSN